MVWAPLFEIKPDPQELADIERTLSGIPGAIDRVAYRAINTALGKMKSLTTKAAAKKLGLKQKVVRQRVWLKRANRKRLYGRITGGRVGWPLILWDATQEGKAPVPGGGVTIPKLGYSVPHAFLATMPTGHKGVWLRSKYIAGGELTKRRPTTIVEQRSESVTKVIEDAAESPEILRVGGVVLEKRMLVEMELILSGKRK